MHTGSGQSFRTRSTLETVAAAAARFLPGGLRALLRGRYEQALSRLHPERLVCTLPGGERIRLLPSLRQVTWNADEYEAFRRDLQAGDVVLDVGANLGAYTMLFAQWVGPAGRVLAFEPAPAPFEGLTRLVEANGLTARVTAMNVAVAAEEGHVRFLADRMDGANRIAGDGALTVPTTTIDAICRREAIVPRLIKIDVEGAELDALKGARETIAAAGSRLRLYVEMHPHLWNDFGIGRRDVEAELARQGLRAERLDGQPDVWSIEGVCLRLVPCAS